jgi:hypothetical protein
MVQAPGAHSGQQGRGTDLQTPAPGEKKPEEGDEEGQEEALMARHSFDEINPQLLESRLGLCTPELRAIISRLREAAEQAGSDVCVRVYCYDKPSRWGLTYRAECDDNQTWFCHLHPKYSKRFNYVAVHLRDVPDDALVAAGFKRVGDPRQADVFWFPVQTLERAERAAKFIHEAHGHAARL